MNVTHRDEIPLSLVLIDDSHQTIGLACGTEENLALTILYILLNIESHHLGDAEVFHILGNSDTEFTAQIEEMVHCVT